MGSFGSSTCLPLASKETHGFPLAPLPPLPNQGRPKSLAEDLLWVPWSLVHVDCCDTLGNKSPALRLCGDGQETCGYGGKADDHHRADTKDAAANVVGPVSKADVWAMFMTTTRACTETHRSG